MPHFTNWPDYLRELRRIKSVLSMKAASPALLSFVATLISLIENGNYEEARAYFRQQPSAILTESQTKGEEIPPPPPISPSGGKRRP